MTTRIRLGWESQLDQITLTFDFGVLGVGFIVVGPLLGWSAWINVPMIVIGSLLLLMVLLRLHSWRSLWWRRDLVVSPERIVQETRTKRAFRIAWRKLGAVGVYSEKGAKSQVLVMRYKADGKVERVRLPQRSELAAAFHTEAPADWSRLAAGPWDVLLTAPGEESLPDPDPRQPTVVNIGKRSRIQGVGGGLLIVAIAVGMLSVVFTAHDIGTRLIGLFFGIPFGAFALFALVAAPMAARKRRFVIDGHGFALEDPDPESVTLSWEEIIGVGTDIAARGAHFVGTATPSLELDSVLVATREKTLVFRLGSQPKSVSEIRAGVQEFAPDRWEGVNVHPAGPFQIR